MNSRRGWEPEDTAYTAMRCAHNNRVNSGFFILWSLSRSVSLCFFKLDQSTTYIAVLKYSLICISIADPIQAHNKLINAPWTALEYLGNSIRV